MTVPPWEGWLIETTADLKLLSLTQDLHDLVIVDSSQTYKAAFHFGTDQCAAGGPLSIDSPGWDPSSTPIGGRNLNLYS